MRLSDFSGSSRNRNRNPIPSFPRATGNRSGPLSRRPASKRRSTGGLFLAELPPQDIVLWPRAHPGRRHFPKRIHGHCQRVTLPLFVVESAVHGMTITSRKREHERSAMRTPPRAHAFQEPPARSRRREEAERAVGDSIRLLTSAATRCMAAIEVKIFWRLLSILNTDSRNKPPHPRAPTQEAPPAGTNARSQRASCGWISPCPVINNTGALPYFFFSKTQWSTGSVDRKDPFIKAEFGLNRLSNSQHPEVHVRISRTIRASMTPVSLS